MSAISRPSVAPPSVPRRKTLTAADWLRALGDVPLDRILLDPPPGTVTVEHYVRIDGRVDDRLVELVNHTLVEKPMGMLEGAIGAVVIRILGTFVHAHRLGVVLDSQGMIRMFGGNIRMPDVSFIANADLDREKLRTEAAPQFKPTLAVEVISESNTPAEMDKKLREYFESGCRVAWLLYPTNQTLRVYQSPEKFRQLAADDTLDGGDVLPGFSVNVGELFDV